MQFVDWQLMLTFELKFRLLVLQKKVPLLLSFGQYLHEAGRLQGRVKASFSSFCLVLVDARTKWSNRLGPQFSVPSLVGFPFF